MLTPGALLILAAQPISAQGDSADEILSAADIARLVALTGLSKEDLKIGMDVAAETATKDGPF